MAAEATSLEMTRLESVGCEASGPRTMHNITAKWRSRVAKGSRGTRSAWHREWRETVFRDGWSRMQCCREAE